MDLPQILAIAVFIKSLDLMLLRQIERQLGCLKTIDPEGVKRRKAHKLKRRAYESQGPNFMWHILPSDTTPQITPFLREYFFTPLWRKIKSSCRAGSGCKDKL